MASCIGFFSLSLFCRQMVPVPVSIQSVSYSATQAMQAGVGLSWCTSTCSGLSARPWFPCRGQCRIFGLPPPTAVGFWSFPPPFLIPSFLLFHTRTTPLCFNTSDLHLSSSSHWAMSPGPGLGGTCLPHSSSPACGISSMTLHRVPQRHSPPARERYWARVMWLTPVVSQEGVIIPSSSHSSVGYVLRIRRLWSWEVVQFMWRHTGNLPNQVIGLQSPNPTLFSETWFFWPRSA